jgi:hypothetical protein
MNTARPAISVADALHSKKLFGPFFTGPSWNTWRAVLKAGFAEPLSKSELETFQSVAERDPPAHRVKELVAIVGRGGGKDSTASAIAAYIGMSFDPRAAKLRPGELAYVLCLAVDKDQSGIVFRYIAALFETVPTLKAMVKTFGTDSIELRNRVVIQVTTNSYRSIRGRSVLAAIFDEIAFWRDERAANPDTEVHGAISPGLARVAGSMLILISSAHRRSGLLYERWKSFYGKPDDDVLVVRGTTTQFNPSFDRALIDKSLALDPQRYSAEYNSEWRDDLSTFLSRDLLDASVEAGVLVRPPLDNVTYYAFADPSSGRGDSFTLSLSHLEQHGGSQRVVIDLLYEKRPPFNPSEAIEEIAALLRSYRCSTVTGDRYAAGFVVEAFRNQKIEYRHSKLDRSEIYLGFLPIVTAGQLLMLDLPRAIAEFAGLVRRTFPSGKDRVNHELNGHDDMANSIAGAAVLASASNREQVIPLVGPIIVGGSAIPSPIPGQSTTAAYLEWAGHTRNPWVST